MKQPTTWNNLRFKGIAGSLTGEDTDRNIILIINEHMQFNPPVDLDDAAIGSAQTKTYKEAPSIEPSPLDSRVKESAMEYLESVYGLNPTLPIALKRFSLMKTLLLSRTVVKSTHHEEGWTRIA